MEKFLNSWKRNLQFNPPSHLIPQIGKGEESRESDKNRRPNGLKFRNSNISTTITIINDKELTY